MSRPSLAREGVRRMLMEALEAEVAAYVEGHRAQRREDGRALVVRNGRRQPRQVTTEARTVEVQAPRVHDQRWADGLKKLTEEVEGFGF